MFMFHAFQWDGNDLHGSVFDLWLKPWNLQHQRERVRNTWCIMCVHGMAVTYMVYHVCSWYGSYID
jgi:hypothetical protein